MMNPDLDLRQKRVNGAVHYRPHPKDDGRLYFHFVCQSTPGGGIPDPALDGGGVPDPALDGGGGGGPGLSKGKNF